MVEGEKFENGRIAGLQVVSALGSGGFGSVWLAHDPRIDRLVAVKVLHGNQAADPELRDRFIQEARFLDRAGIDLVVGVHALDELPDGRPYIVMEYAQGGSLEGRLTDRLGPSGAPAAELATIIDGLGRCLEALHRAGLVHRDIKPANVLIRRRGEAEPPADRLLGPTEQLVLADFGVARTAGPGAHSAASIVVHSYGWSAPEQMLSVQAPDHRADLFAASMIVLWAATGQPPVWTGQGPIPVEVPANLGARGPRFEAELRRGLAFSPDDRHSTATDWTRNLLDALAADPGQSPTTVAPPTLPEAAASWPPPTPTIDPGPAVQAPTPAGPPDARDGSPSPGRRRLLAGLGAVAAVALLGVGSAAVTMRGGDAPTVIGPTQASVGDDVVFVAPDGDVQWTVAGQTLQDRVATITPTQPGRLAVEVADGESTRTIMVTVGDTPQHPISGPGLIATGGRGVFTVPSAPEGATITWSDGRNAVTDRTLTLLPSSSGIVMLEARITDPDGRAETVTLRPITVEP